MEFIINNNFISFAGLECKKTKFCLHPDFWYFSFRGKMSQQYMIENYGNKYELGNII